MEYEFIKCHGSGNDFLIIDEMTNSYVFSEKEREKLALLLCNRTQGIGADGILFVLKSDHADARMRVFNSDGSEASMCGNGLRCVARYVCELKGIDRALIETMKADLIVAKREDIYPSVATYQVEISPVSFKAADLPLHIDQTELVFEKIPRISKELQFSALAVPNPHLITIVDTSEIHSETQKEISEYLNGPNELCPDGVNVSFVKFLKKGHIYVRTFERGVGFTNACGTAMSASTLITCLKGLNGFEEEIKVYNNGGKVHCVVHENEGVYSIDLIGNATYLFRSTVEVDSLLQAFEVKDTEVSKEQQIFAKLQEEVKGILNELLN